jgi:competence protein ComEA
MSNPILTRTAVAIFIAAISFVRPAEAAPRKPIEVSGVVNLNTASEAQLRLLPGVGLKKAQRIDEARKKHKFESTEQIMKVKGFGKITYRKLKPHLAVTGATTIARLSPKDPPPAGAKSKAAKPDSLF